MSFIYMRVRDNAGLYRRRKGSSGTAKQFTFSLDKKSKTAVYLRDGVELISDPKVLTPGFLRDIKFFLRLEKLPTVGDLSTVLEDHGYSSVIENTKAQLLVTVEPMVVSELYHTMLHHLPAYWPHVYAKLEDASTDELLQSHPAFGTIYELAHAVLDDEKSEQVRLYVLSRLEPLYPAKPYGPAELVKRMIEFREFRSETTPGHDETRVTLNGRQAFHSVSTAREPGDAISSVIHLVTGKNDMLSRPTYSMSVAEGMHVVVTSIAEPVAVLSYNEWPHAKTLLLHTSPEAQAQAIDDLLLDHAVSITEDHLRFTCEPNLWLMAQTKVQEGDFSWLPVNETMHSFGANVFW